MVRRSRKRNTCQVSDAFHQSFSKSSSSTQIRSLGKSLYCKGKETLKSVWNCAQFIPRERTNAIPQNSSFQPISSHLVEIHTKSYYCLSFLFMLINGRHEVSLSLELKVKTGNLWLGPSQSRLLLAKLTLAETFKSEYIPAKNSSPKSQLWTCWDKL